MATRFVNMDRETRMFRPYDLREWVPALPDIFRYGRSPASVGGRAPIGRFGHVREKLVGA